MNNIRYLLPFLLLTVALQAVEIPVETSKIRNFGKSVKVNAKIIQQSNARQSVMSLVSGHIEAYYVQAGQRIKKGQKIARIDSITLSKMTAEQISLKAQFAGMDENYKAAKVLYDKGMVSMQDLNLQKIEHNAMQARIAALDSQLKTLDIDTDKLKNATSTYILYAHSGGKVAAVLQPLHSVISDDAAIVSIVKEQAFYLQSYLPLRYASMVKKGQKVVIAGDGDSVSGHVTQILPKVDETTQRIIVLSSIDRASSDLYINQYVSATIYFDADKQYVAVKKSALSFYKNEWVVFIPEHYDGKDHDEERDEHQGEVGELPQSKRVSPGGLSSAQERDHLDGDHDDHEGHEGHDDHEEADVSYDVKVIKILTEDDHYVAIKGLDDGETYVSDKSYYVKSMLLKSSLGGHGH